MDLVIAVIGLAILLGAGDALVRGAVAMSLRLGVPALIISLTVIAFGTSAPELLIAVEAALANAPGIVFGNVVGSNTANVLLVLGLPALISTIESRDCQSMRNYAFMLVVTVIFIALCFIGPLRWWHGVVLLALLAWMLNDAYDAALRARREGRESELERELEEEMEEIEEHEPWWKLGGLIAIGLIGLPLGAHLLVEGARGVATQYGVSEAAIGLSLVAVGTSLPELATTVVAAMRRHADVALGNVIGSNLFNLAAIMGAASFLGPLAVPSTILQVDLWVMLAASLLLYPFVCSIANMSRLVGTGFLAVYAIYIWYVLTTSM